MGKLTIEKMVDRIPHDGDWYKSGSRDTFVSVAKKLSHWGLELDEIEEVLSALYYAVAALYGE